MSMQGFRGNCDSKGKQRSVFAEPNAIGFSKSHPNIYTQQQRNEDNMKQHCPSCGKKFDYEQHGWICPFCGQVILGSTEQAAHQQESATPPPPAKKPSRKLKKLSVLFTVGLLLTVSSFGYRIGKNLIYLRQKQTSEPVSYPVETIEMQQTISIEPYQLTIQQAYLFPQTLITAPKSGEYLAVSYTSSGKSSDSSIQRIDDVAWAALKFEQTNQYITPLSLGDVTGSDAIWSDLSDMGVDWELHNGMGILLFLLPEETDLEQLNLCIFAGTESEDAHRYAQNAVSVQTVYEIPLTVTDSSDMEGMDV